MPNELENTLDALPPIQFGPKSGFTENWRDALGLAIVEDLPITSRAIPSTTESMRTKLLFDKYQDGSISDDAWQYYVNEDGIDYDGLSDYANKYLGLTDVPTREDYEKSRQEEYANYRLTSQETFDRQTMWGSVGQFTGNMHAMALDPLYAVSFFTGYGSATTALQAFGRVAASEMLIETAAQPLVMDWKDQVGAEYGAADAFVNILSTGILAGSMSGIGKAVDIRVKDALDGLDSLGVSNSNVFAPVAHTMRNTEGSVYVRDMIIRDEAIEKAMNERGSKVGTDVAPETFSDRMASIETYRAEARDMAMQAQDTLRTFDENLMGDLAPLSLEKAELKTLRSLEAKAGTPESDVNVQLINDRLDELNQAVTDMDLPAYLRTREALLESIEDWKAKTTGTPEELVPIQRIETELKKTIEEAPPARAKIQEDVSSKTQLMEGDTPIQREAYKNITDIDEKIARMEEIC